MMEDEKDMYYVWMGQKYISQKLLERNIHQGFQLLYMRIGLISDVNLKVQCL
jgi:hypothetical protein